MQWVSGIACRRDGSWTPPKGKAPCLRMLYWSTTSTAMSICCKHSWSADNCVSSSQCSLCWGTQQGLPKIRAAMNCWLLAHGTVSVLRSIAVKGNASPSQKSFLNLVATPISQRYCSCLTQADLLMLERMGEHQWKSWPCLPWAQTLSWQDTHWFRFGDHSSVTGALSWRQHAPSAIPVSSPKRPFFLSGKNWELCMCWKKKKKGPNPTQLMKFRHRIVLLGPSYGREHC